MLFLVIIKMIYDLYIFHASRWKIPIHFQDIWFYILIKSCFECDLLGFMLIAE